jgi:small subunit ribosomal protein S1
MEDNTFDCNITRVAGAGLEVDLDDGRRGFIPRKELSWALSAPHPPLKWKVGQKIRALYIGEENGRLSFSIKQLTIDPWQLAKNKYQIGQLVEGKVSAIFSDDSIFIEIEEGV